MGPELLLLTVPFSLMILVLGWEVWRRRRGPNAPTCPHCGGRLRSIEPGRRYCKRCDRYFRRLS